MKADFKKFNDDEKDLMKARGLPWRLWEVLFRAPSSIIVKNVVNGEVRLIEKERISS
jgi:hypothetical protein